MTTYLPRLVDDLITQVMAGLPAVLLVGPRACGKTTTAVRHAQTVVRLDREDEAAAFKANPDSALARLPEPVLLDEWQMVPGVLGAVKRAIDSGSGPNRYLITGSVRADLEAEGWPLTGRVVRISMAGLTERELHGAVAPPALLDRLGSDGVDAFSIPDSPPDLVGYIELALRGTFPESVLAPSDALGRRWLDSYVEQLITRDADLADGGRDPQRLRRYLEMLCLNTAGIVDAQTLYGGAGINAKTATAYDRLLRNLLVIDELPGWWNNRIKRLIKRPKRYVVDPGAVGAVLRLDVRGVLREGNLLGPLLDTFAMAQLRAEVAVAETRPRLHHLRIEQGRHEIDIVAEYGGGRIFAFEVKATAGPSPADGRHLSWLRDHIGSRFIGGAVLHTGPRMYELSDRIAAVPICALWG